MTSRVHSKQNKSYFSLSKRANQIMGGECWETSSASTILMCVHFLWVSSSLCKLRSFIAGLDWSFLKEDENELEIG